LASAKIAQPEAILFFIIRNQKTSGRSLSPERYTQGNIFKYFARSRHYKRKICKNS